MATLEKIRKHGVLLLIIVGLAMLAFIVGDFLNSSATFFNRNREYVGTVAGEKIHFTEYEAAKNQLTEVYKIESNRNDLDEETQVQLRNQVWQFIELDKILSQQAEKCGLMVTKEELNELCMGANPHQVIRSRRVFYDETGNFNRENIIRFLASLSQEPQNEEHAEILKQYKSYWAYWEKVVRLSQLQEKYTNLLSMATTANSVDAEFAAKGRQQKALAHYVMQPYRAISDSAISVSNAEIRKLYNQRKEQYRQDENCTVKYIAYDIVPSAEDFAEVEKWINDLAEEFKTTDEIASLVNSNSDILYTAQNYSESTIPAKYKDFAFRKGAKAGDFADITFADNTYSMARIVEAGYSLPDSIELRFAIASNDAEIDSIKAAWKQGNVGDNPTQWISEDMLSHETAEKAFSKAKNEIFTEAYGLNTRIYQVVDRSASTPKVKLAIVERQVAASSKTISIIYNTAKQFIAENNTEEKFIAAAEEQGKHIEEVPNIQKSNENIGSLAQSRQIVRWAFGAEEGAISDVFECGEQFVIADLAELRLTQYRPIEDVTAELRMQIIKDKKAKQIMEDLKDAKTLDEVAQKTGQSIQIADGVNFESYAFGNSGIEPAVIGAALAAEVNTLSAPIQGENGVYVLLVEARTDASDEVDKASEIAQLNQRYAYQLPYMALNLLEENAEIEDNRLKFY